MRLTRRAALAGAGAVALISRADAAFFQGALNNTAVSGPVFAGINIGGGGYVTGLSIAPDGTMVCRCDTNGAYLNSTASIGVWQPIITYNSMPAGSFGFSGGDSGGSLITSQPYGPWEIAIAPSDTNKAYMLWNNGMYYTSNLKSPSISWTQMTNFPTITGANGNSGSNRLYQQKMAVDPANPDVVLIGTPSNGLYATYNGTSGASATFTHITAVTASSGNGTNGIAFDSSSGTTTSGAASPATQTVTAYAGSYGQGVFTTTNGGVSWGAAGSGGPTNIQGGCCASGHYYAAASAVSMYDGAAWHAFSGGGTVVGVTINPFDATWLAGWSNGGGNLTQATISGTSATYAVSNGYQQTGLNPNVPPSDVGWISITNPEYSGIYLAAGGVQFDPITTNRLWFSFGYGVGYWDIPSKTLSGLTNIALTTVTAGIQNMVTTRPVSQPGYDLLCAVEDQQLFQITSLTTAPGNPTVQLGSRANNNSVWDIDWSQSVAGVVAALSSGYYVNTYNYSGYSTDGGSTWTQFSTQPFSTDGGCITCIDHLRMVAVVAGTGKTPVYTTNGGSSWSNTNLPSAEYYHFGGDPPSANPHMLTNDAAGYIYAYSPGNGTYKSNYAGASFDGTFTKQSSTAVGGVYLGSIQAVPGNASYLVACAGYPVSGPYPDSGTHLYTSANGGATWTNVSNVESPFWFGFGQVYPGYTYPTLWVWGFVNKGGAGYTWGVWRSRDLGASDWTYITDWANHLDFPTSLTGDMNDYTKFYMGFAGSSFVYASNVT